MKLISLLALAACLNLALPANAGTLFHGPKPFSTGEPGTSSIAVADLRGIGTLDIVVANRNCPEECSAGTVSVLLGNGDGTFQAPVAYSSGGNNAPSLAVADVNGDGKPDVIVVNEYTTTDAIEGVVGVLLGNGDGTLQPVVTYSSGGDFPSSIAVADVNGDGNPDVLVGNQNNGTADGTIAVLLGNGNGTFQPAVTYSAPNCCNMAVADLRGNGKLDVVVVNSNTDAGAQPYPAGVVSIMLGNGDGTFNSQVSYGSGGYSASAVTVADVNGDGKPDLVVANWYQQSGYCCAGAVGVLFGNGDGTFQSVAKYSSGGGDADAVGVVDVNGDGILSIVVVNGAFSSQVGKVATLLNNGDGTFQNPTTASMYSSSGYSPTSVAVADVNGDGRQDLLVTNSCTSEGLCMGETGSVSVLLRVAMATTTKVTSSPNPSTSGQSVTFTSTTTSKSPIQDGQTVTFYDGVVKIGTGTTSGGVATFTTSSLSARTHVIKASYPGNFDFKASAGTVKQVVNP